MKIVILLSRIDQTGVTTHTLDLVSGIVKEEHEVFLITSGPIEKNNPRLESIYDDFKKLGIHIKLFTFPKGNKLRRGFYSIYSLIKALFYVTVIKADIIHAQSPYMSFIPWLLGKKFTSTLHVNDFVKSFKYKNATHLIAISKETKQYAIDLFGYKEKDISIVNHGVSKDFANTMSTLEKSNYKQKYKLPLDKIIIGFVGSIEKRKGHDLLIKAVQNLAPEIQNKMHLVFLGSSKHSDTKQWLDNLIESSTILHLISRFDYQDPKPFYGIYDVFVLPSRLEGFPLVVIEAMMSECCVIRSNVQGAYDQINHGIDGYLFTNERDDELTILLEELIIDNDKRLKVANLGKQKALNKFTIEEMTSGTLKVYEKLI
jgi:glycosyltransferase involved in cell wall biosynthesis